jgi:hypothetical protein
MSKEEKIEQRPEDGKTESLEENMNETILPSEAIEQNETPGITTSSIQNMEVHHHTHADHGKKNWKAYFWEFLMLFLAVFCGFLAENQREHMVEHNREKEYMRSMIEDLKQDTAEYNRGIKLINHYFIPVLSKSTALLYGESFSDGIIREMYDTIPKSTRFFFIIIQDNTVTQLINSGNLRLIRNKTVTDGLAKYWNSCDHLKSTLIASYDITRLHSKDLTFSIFNLHYFENNSPIDSLRKNISPKLMLNDRSNFIKLANDLSNMNSQLSGAIFQRLKSLHLKATDLITLIEKEYPLE